MPAPTLTTVRPAAVTFAEILPWAALGALLFGIGLYFVGVEQGAAALFDGARVHEFLHDGRHLLGFPCH